MSQKVQLLAANQAVDNLHDLEGIAEQIFGSSNRPKGWFHRKLQREGVDSQLSVIARQGARICGYILLGRDEHLSSIAYGAGMGVVPQMRGCGLGRRLVEQAQQQVTDAGLCSIELVTTNEVDSFYHHLGFRESTQQTTLMGIARGMQICDDAVEFYSACPWDPQTEDKCYEQICGWHPHIWNRTSINGKFTIRIALNQHEVAWIHLSREGSAFLIQRLLIPQYDVDLSRVQTIQFIADRLLAALPQDRPCLLYGCPRNNRETRIFLEHGWQCAQNFSIMRWSKFDV